MKAKLTVSIDEEVVPRAKRYAQSQGLSLSALIEEDLRRIVALPNRFSERWRGKLTLSPKQSARYRRLTRKHG